MQTTYKDAKEKDNSITMNDVKDFFEEFVEKKNSCRYASQTVGCKHELMGMRNAIAKTSA